MTINRSTFILFSVKCFFQLKYTNYAYFDKKITLKSYAQKLKLKLSLVGPLLKTCVTIYPLYKNMCDNSPSIQKHV